jgi:NAD(P)-dependent dehydrogenase (short-subunit alcohol dehydrogenase family)
MMTKQQIVIIGGSEGIGLAVAKAARTLGARVLAVSRTRAKLEAARDAVSGLEIRVADINNTASIEELFSELLTVDHVYIAAGSTKIGGPLDHPLNGFRHKFDERLWGSIDVVRAAHRYPDVGPYLSGERSTSAQRRDKETADSPSGDRR